MKKSASFYLLNPVFLSGIIIFVLSLIFFVATLYLEKSKPLTTVSRASGTKQQIIPTVMYTSIDEISVVPRRINDHLFSSNLLIEFEKIYPSLSPKDAQSNLIRQTVEWAALRDFFETNHVVIPELITTNEVSATQLTQELPILKEKYLGEVIKLDGFFLKVRFAGIYPKGIDALQKTPEELKLAAKDALQGYIDKSSKLAKPSNILTTFNNDEMVKIMNNDEPSSAFTEYSLEPPLFDDPNFYTILESAPVGSFSPIITLQTKNPQASKLEEYAYVSFYVSNKTNLYLPLDQIVSEYVKVATIR